MKTRSGCEVLSVSNEHLDFLVEELTEECTRVLQLIQQLKKTGPASKTRDHLEGDFYAALVHLKDHIPALLKEWDRMDLGD